MTETWNWRNVEQRRGAIQSAAQALLAGKLVAFPLETGYGIVSNALAADAVQSLAQNNGASADVALALTSSSAVGDWAPGLNQVGRRLARRCWPGPFTMLVETGMTDGLLSRLPASVRQHLCGEAGVRLRMPAHEALRHAGRLLSVPLVLKEIVPSPTTLGSDELESWRRHVELVIDDGPSSGGPAASVVRLTGEKWELLHEGIVPAATLHELSACIVLFVCTGNTCRSPLAEGLCKKLLAERLGCEMAELPRHGYVVLSAGISAMPGCPAAAEAVMTALSHGVSLEDHVSQPASGNLLTQADFVFAMTAGHRHAVTMHYPEVAAHVHLLSPDEQDIADPIGGDDNIYRQCAEEILGCLRQRLALLAP